jgi:hypothetical protein
MRTNEEILEKIESVKESDFFGVKVNDLLVRLPFDCAKKFLVDDAVESEWVVQPRDRESIVKEMQEYMPFAWDKANGCRGLSAARSMDHYSAWVWLCGDDLGDLSDYEYYGKDNLVKICNQYGFDSSQWDDGVRVN